MSTVEFNSRDAARAYAKANGGKVVDNGKDAAVRWSVDNGEVKQEAPALVVTEYANKRDRAIKIYNAAVNAGLSRQEIMQQFIDQMGIASNTAYVYVSRIKHGKH